jgi:hypothetical protein
MIILKISKREYGLLYTSSTKQVEKIHYNNGRYFIGLRNKFIRYPSEIIEFRFEKEEVINKKI